jgi:ABC-type transporter Mla MlaB component
MPLTFKPSADNKSVVIVVHGHFDLSLTAELWRAFRQGKLLPVEKVIVDMGKVEAVFDSGFVLLMALRQWSSRVHVINYDVKAAKRVDTLGMKIPALATEPAT